MSVLVLLKVVHVVLVSHSVLLLFSVGYIHQKELGLVDSKQMLQAGMF